jgi:hypothetical protein
VGEQSRSTYREGLAFSKSQFPKPKSQENFNNQTLSPELKPLGNSNNQTLPLGFDNYLGFGTWDFLPMYPPKLEAIIEKKG